MTNKGIESYVQTLARFALKQVRWNDRRISYCEDSLPENDPDRLEPVALSENAKHKIANMPATLAEVCEQGPDRPVEWDQDDEIDNAQDPVGQSTMKSSGSCDSIVVLGQYFRISCAHPTGKIVLYKMSIAGYFWHVVLELLSKHRINAYQLSRLADATALQTVSHELFHYKSDLTTISFGTTSSRKPDNEEALAVAASYEALEWILNEWGRNTPPRTFATPEAVALRKAFVEKVFNFTLPGYRDWRKYGSPQTFGAGVRDHWLPLGVTKRGVVKYGPLSHWYSREYHSPRPFYCTHRERFSLTF